MSDLIRDTKEKHVVTSERLQEMEKRLEKFTGNVNDLQPVLMKLHTEAMDIVKEFIGDIGWKEGAEINFLLWLIWGLSDGIEKWVRLIYKERDKHEG